MKKLNPEKLTVEFSTGATMTEPVIGRKYTLTHSDITADLFLTIGLQFALEKVNAMRDEVLAEWKMGNGFPFLYVYVYVDGEFDPAVTARRNAIFRREMPLALEAIRYGDRKFFATHSALDRAPIWIHFDSTNPLYNKFENWGTPGDYQ
ncbi:staygreen family protein [Jeotgalibacillus sp. ET6]|uniref:staygreen family protein n=1 Tax=Jeotgalibacillus sp. ET6 TaxID=3037260 RepID=UPI002418AA02|nr:staygreen family protein [Jeotgalibacillus sp. ET6]MDG5473624.1 staygreen family protein [Jeotgalibacillus sp. ET6]